MMIKSDYRPINGFTPPSMNNALRLVILMAACFSAGACVYRINIQQGNYLDYAAVEQVKAGMTRSQVRYLLGTPMVADSFDKGRWDYIYYLKKGRTRHIDERRVTVYFEGEKVAKLDKPPQSVFIEQDKSLGAVKSRRIY